MKANVRLNFGLASRFANAVADQVLIFAVPMFVYSVSKSVSYAAFVFCLEWIPRLISIPLGGSLVDLYGTSKVFKVADISRCLLALLMFFYVFYNPIPNFMVLGLMSGAIGFFHEQAYIALESSVPHLAGEAGIVKLQSKLQFIDIIGQILGPAAAAYALNFFDIKYLFIVVSFVYILSFFSVSLLPNSGVADFKNTILKSVAEGFSILFKSRQLVSISIVTFFANIIYGALLAIAPGYSQHNLKWSAQVFGTFMSFSAMFSALVFMIIPFIEKRLNFDAVGKMSFFLVALGGIIFSLGESNYIFAMSFYITLLGDAVWGIFMRSKRVQFIPKDKLGSVLSVSILLNLTAMPIGSAIAAQLESVGLLEYYFPVAGILAIAIYLKEKKHIFG